MIGMLEAVRGCLKEEMRMDVISNNLANATAAGFKKDRISFRQILSTTIQGDLSSGATPDTSPAPALLRIQPDFSQGETHSSGNTLDFSINGKGFFKVLTPQGVRYTRKGDFALDSQGYLVTQGGDRVLGKNGPINISGDEVQVDKKGRMEVDGSVVDQLDVVDISDTKQLIKETGLLFRADSGAQELPLPAETMIQQGSLEDSNVNIAEEMVNMIHSTRAFESYQKAIQTLNRLDDKATNDVGRVS